MFVQFSSPPTFTHPHMLYSTSLPLTRSISHLHSPEILFSPLSVRTLCAAGEGKKELTRSWQPTGQLTVCNPLTFVTLRKREADCQLPRAQSIQRGPPTQAAHQPAHRSTQHTGPTSTQAQPAHRSTSTQAQPAHRPTQHTGPRSTQAHAPALTHFSCSVASVYFVAPVSS